MNVVFFNTFLTLLFMSVIIRFSGSLIMMIFDFCWIIIGNIIIFFLLGLIFLQEKIFQPKRTPCLMSEGQEVLAAIGIFFICRLLTVSVVLNLHQAPYFRRQRVEQQSLRSDCWYSGLSELSEWPELSGQM